MPKVSPRYAPTWVRVWVEFLFFCVRSIRRRHESCAYWRSYKVWAQTGKPEAVTASDVMCAVCVLCTRVMHMRCAALLLAVPLSTSNFFSASASSSDELQLPAAWLMQPRHEVPIYSIRCGEKSASLAGPLWLPHLLICSIDFTSTFCACQYDIIMYITPGVSSIAYHSISFSLCFCRGNLLCFLIL